MFELTPGERRGAMVVLALCALGTIWDLLHVEPVPAPPAPAPVAAAAPAAPSGTVPAAGARVDLSTADAAALDALPGIGPVLAARIVAYRNAHGPFHSPDELLAVPGIGPRLLERLRPLVAAGASRTEPHAGAVRNATPSER